MKAYASYSVANKEPNRDDFEAGALQQPLPERLHDIEAAMKSKTMAAAEGNEEYVRMNEDAIKELNK